MKTLKISDKIKDIARNRKVQLAVALTISGVGFLAPDDSKSTNFCSPGNNGDCLLTTGGNKHCTAGDFWNNCT